MAKERDEDELTIADAVDFDEAGCATAESANSKFTKRNREAESKAASKTAGCNRSEQ